jgi:hypothetical protein
MPRILFSLALKLSWACFPYFGYVDWHTFWFVVASSYIFQFMVINYEAAARKELREKTEKV